MYNRIAPRARLAGRCDSKRGSRLRTQLPATAIPTALLAALAGHATRIAVEVTLVGAVWRFATSRAFLGTVIALYLMLGFFWGTAFSILEYGSPGSFANICAPEHPRGDCRPEIGSFPRLFYFSFVTMTTLGYGNIAPLGRAAEGMCTIAAVTGQLFIALLVDRLVGLYIAHDDRPTDAVCI